MLGFVSVHIQWNAMSNLALGRSNNALQSESVLQSASTLSNICRTEYTLTVDAIKKQLPSTNKVSLALDGWTSTNKLAITSVIAYYMD
jgi:chaperone required for assembly of F1-ATPase